MALKTILLICMHACTCVCVQVRGQRAGAGSLPLPCGSWGLNSGQQPWHPAAEPFHQPIMET